MVKSKKNNLELMEIFGEIAQKRLTPNQFYLMCCIRENVASQHINVHAELRVLVKEKWLKDLSNADGNKYELSEDAHKLLDLLDGYFKISKKKVNKSVMGDDYSKNIESYLNLFPKLRLPSGKPARSDKKNVQVAMEWFMKNYEYSWDVILKATALYVDEYERKNYMYMQTSQYFIRKQQSDKTWGSELANMCAIVESGDTQSDDNYFSENVV